jgi:Zn-finger nucleic acid-binding protein
VAGPDSRCPKCGPGLLAELDGGNVSRCTKCLGFWVPPEALLLSNIVGRLQELDVQPAQKLEQDQRTGPCPDGHGLLRRARATNEDPYFLERCARCGGIWFDPGEWSRLASDHLLADLTSLWSPAWREHLSEEHNRASLEADLRHKLGGETFEMLERLATKLSDQGLGALALAYLRERLRER